MSFSPPKQQQQAQVQEVHKDDLKLVVVDDADNALQQQVHLDENDNSDATVDEDEDEDEDGNDDEEVKCITHYNSVQQILLVGDGDFSFSLSLANAFNSAENIVATSLDSYADLLKKYGKAESNLKTLSEKGATIIHGVDATKLKSHTDLKMRKFDRIVFNFPHAGFKGREDLNRVIRLHRSLVRSFFHNASQMLRPDGEVHISHKTGEPFRQWNLVELASKSSLVLVECPNFNISDYPGYNNKRGEGSRCDEPFPLNECSTYKFRIGKICKRKPLQQIPIQDSRIHVGGGSQFGNRYQDGMGTNIIDYPQAVHQLSLPALHRQNTLMHDRLILHRESDYICSRPAEHKLHFRQPHEHHILASQSESSVWVGTHFGHAQATVSIVAPPLLHRHETFSTQREIEMPRPRIDYFQSAASNWPRPVLHTPHVLFPGREIARIRPQDPYAVQDSPRLRNDFADLKHQNQGCLGL